MPPMKEVEVFMGRVIDDVGEHGEGLIERKFYAKNKVKTHHNTHAFEHQNFKNRNIFEKKSPIVA